jgi:hypothetical protein
MRCRVRVVHPGCFAMNMLCRAAPPRTWQSTLRASARSCGARPHFHIQHSLSQRCEPRCGVQGKCRQKVTQAQIQAAEDYRLNANLYDACKADAENVCKDVEAGSGRVNACLRDNRDKVRMYALTCIGAVLCITWRPSNTLTRRPRHASLSRVCPGSRRFRRRPC